MSARSISLSIGRTFDDQVAHEVVASVDLCLPSDPSADHFTVNVQSPVYNDPMPPNCIAGAAYDGLWEFEVVELFIARQVGDTYQYLELEFSPHGCHLILQLDGVRRLKATRLPITSVQTEITDNSWKATATVPMSYLPPFENSSLNDNYSIQQYRLNAFAIHGTGDQRRYLCAAGFSGDTQPDFHQPSRFPAVQL